MSEIREEIVRCVNETPKSERRAKIQEWAQLSGYSASTIYRWTMQATSGSSASPKTGRRRNISPEAWGKIVKIYLLYRFSEQELVAHALANNWVAPPGPHPKTISRWLREDGIGRNTMKDTGKAGLSPAIEPHLTIEAPDPNKVQQMDLTEIPRWHVNKRNIGFESALVKGKNKEGNRMPRIHLYVIVDDFSRLCYARLYETKEAAGWIDFCIKSWSEDLGVPDVLYIDNDSAAKSGLFSAFAEKVGCHIQHHAVGNPRAKGKVERLIGTLQGRLTRALKPVLDIRGEVSLEQANDLLEKIVGAYNACPHSSTGLPPIIRYRDGLGDQAARRIPEHIDDQYFYERDYTPLLRTDWSIRLDGISYQLPRTEPYTSLIGQRIAARAHHLPAERHRFIVSIDETDYIIPAEQVVPHETGEWKSAPHSESMKMANRALEANIDDFDPLAVYDMASESAEPAAPNTAPLPAPQPPQPTYTRRQVKLRLIRDGVTHAITPTIEAVVNSHEFDIYTEQDYQAIVVGLNR